MLDVCLLGTGGTVPLKNRWLTSCLLTCNGHSLLIDCGEATQIALQDHGFSCRHIDTILLTHYHTDHTGGLPGLLLSMAKANRVEPITIIGPKGLQEILAGVYVLARYIPFEIIFREIEKEEETLNVAGLEVTAFKVDHRVLTYGYKIHLPRQPKFEVEKAKENNVPLKFWSLLQKGQTVEEDGITYSPDMVLGKERKGLTVVYVTDTRPTESIVNNAKEADLFIAEGMYGDEEKMENALKHKHMLMKESAAMAKEANVKELWFTHYSTSMVVPQEYEETMKEIFPNCVISKDGQRKMLYFESEE